MRIITKKIKAYNFEDIKNNVDGIQEKVLHELNDINVNYEWWQNTYDDAEIIGLKITGFDIDRASSCKGDLMNVAEDSAEKILKIHGENCETYQTAKNYLDELSEFLIGKDENDLNYQDDEDITHIADGFLKSLLENYRIMLRKEYDYNVSEEGILETIENAGYEFNAEGKIIQ